MSSSGDSSLLERQMAAGSSRAALSEEQSSHGEDEYPSSSDSSDNESEGPSDPEAARREARLAERDPILHLLLNRQNPEKLQTDAWLWEINDYNLGLRFPKEIDLKHIKCLFKPQALSNEFGTIIMGKNGIATRLVLNVNGLKRILVIMRQIDEEYPSSTMPFIVKVQHMWRERWRDGALEVAEQINPLGSGGQARTDPELVLFEQEWTVRQVLWLAAQHAFRFTRDEAACYRHRAKRIRGVHDLESLARYESDDASDELGSEDDGEPEIEDDEESETEDVEKPETEDDEESELASGVGLGDRNETDIDDTTVEIGSVGRDENASSDITIHLGPTLDFFRAIIHPFGHLDGETLRVPHQNWESIMETLELSSLSDSHRIDALFFSTFLTPVTANALKFLFNSDGPDYETLAMRVVMAIVAARRL